MKRYFALGTYREDILFGTGEVFHGKGKGISICEFDDGNIRESSRIQVRNPSFLCLNEAKRKLYAVNEMKEYQGVFGGGLTQLSYDEEGRMEIEKEFPTKGTDPCHVAIAPDGSFLAVSNFASGAVTIFRLDQDGNIVGEGQLYQHQGSSVHPVRQKGPHAHSAIFAPDCRRMYVPDLGVDQVLAYSWSADQVEREMKADLDVLKGSGPRFGEFDQNGKNFYLIHEIGSQVRHYAYKNGRMVQREMVSTLPEDFQGENICADLHITPDGKWLYASNRGHDSLACFKLDQEGNMEFSGTYPCGGKTPRNFSVDPDGRYLLVGNQDSDRIAVMEIGSQGQLKQTGQYECGSPVCIRFFEKPPFNR